MKPFEGFKKELKNIFPIEIFEFTLFSFSGVCTGFSGPKPLQEGRGEEGRHATPTRMIRMIRPYHPNHPGPPEPPPGPPEPPPGPSEPNR